MKPQIMLRASDANLDDLVQQIYIINPNFPRNDEQAAIELRRNLQEQLLNKIPQVELEHLDLKCIIMNVKKSLSEFQRRIDESVNQQLRRTTRVRKTVYQDPAVINFFNPGHKCERKYIQPSTSTTVRTKPANANNTCNKELCELSGLVEVESLPVSATTNLVTIFVPSILQEKLHSCKYKISIDLNRLDLTKKILDLNVRQQINTNLGIESGVSSLPAIKIGADEQIDEQDRNVTYEIKGNLDSLTTVQLVEKQTTNTSESDPKIEIKVSADNSASIEPTVAIEVDAALPAEENIRGSKRKKQQTPSNNPPKKRGRKLGSKNKKKANKSELAKYVEMFTCNATSPSAVSQIVTSTTQNWDITTSESGPIAYFMDGEWTLNGPPKSSSQLVSTTNGTISLDQATGVGQETFIPFEDFVNFIENPSFDAGSNVIARVLDGTVDSGQAGLISQESDVLNLCVESKSDDNIKQNPSTSKAVTEKIEASYNQEKINIVHSMDSNRKNKANGGALDLSKNINTFDDILDLTQKKGNNTPSSDEVNICTIENNVADKTVIFSTSRNMPLIDDMEEGIFCCNPKQSENLQKNIVFSTASPAAHKSRPYSLKDSAVKVDRNNTSRDSSLERTDFSNNSLSSLKDKPKSEIVKGMSLLEIEKDVDDSLLDFDDLLSLAPSSCFNSPTEDRFADSNFLNTDESNTKSSTTNSAAPAPRSHLESIFFKSMEDEPNSALKNFKIPRMKTASDGSLNELSSANVMPKPSPHDLENITNHGVSPLFSSTQLNNNSFVENTCSEIVSITDISTIFGSLCYGFLADTCFDTNCKLSHDLLELTVVTTSLRLVQNEVLNSAYRFIWRHLKLFRFYFPIFCDEYARRNMRRKLLNMISDCEIQPNSLPYLRNIYAALLCCGLNRINACRFILSRVKDRSHVALDTLMEIIIESEAAMFATTIEQFLNITDYKFRMTDINKLATACLRSGSAELTTTLIKCLISVDQAEFATMRSPEMIQLLELIKDGGIDGL